MKILAITANYPHSASPYSGIFVKNTLEGLAKLGHEVVVITPQKFHQAKMPFYSEEVGLKVYRPIYPTFSARKVLGFNTVYLSNTSFEFAVKRTLKKIAFQPDVVYSHFLLPAGVTAAKVAKNFGVKSFCTIGEDNLLNYLNIFNNEKLTYYINLIDYFIPNNFTALNLLSNEFSKKKDDIKFIPNGVDINKFHKMDKLESRKKLGLPLEENIVIAVGGFEERKGPLRVLEACRKSRSQPKIIFIGKGQQEPEGEEIIFKGSVGHDELPLYLNAADVFVMPTKSEGMPNALLEAMACSCNIIASDIEVNKYVLQSYSSYKLIDAIDIQSLSKNIDAFLQQESKQTDNLFEFTLLKRTQQISDFLESKIQSDNL